LPLLLVAGKAAGAALRRVLVEVRRDVLAGARRDRDDPGHVRAGHPGRRVVRLGLAARRARLVRRGLRLRREDLPVGAAAADRVVLVLELGPGDLGVLRVVAGRARDRLSFWLFLAAMSVQGSFLRWPSA
jgi:hypothetical protein